MYLNSRAKLTTGSVLRFEFPITNLEYIDKFGEGFYWEIDVSIFDEPAMQRRKCEAYCSVDGSFRKNYIMEFYISEFEDILTEVESNMKTLIDNVNWKEMIKGIEVDADAYWHDITE